MLIFGFSAFAADNKTIDLTDVQKVIQHQAEIDRLIVSDPQAAREKAALIVDTLRSYMPDQLISLKANIGEHEGRTIRFAINFILKQDWSITDRKDSVDFKIIEKLLLSPWRTKIGAMNVAAAEIIYLLPILELFLDKPIKTLNLSSFSGIKWLTPILMLSSLKKVYVNEKKPFESYDFRPVFFGQIPEWFKKIEIIEAQWKTPSSSDEEEKDLESESD
jgi:hypothetical protein